MSAYREATNLWGGAWEFGMVDPLARDSNAVDVRTTSNAPEFEILGDNTRPTPVSETEDIVDEPVLAAVRDEESTKLWQSFEPALEPQESQTGLSQEVRSEETNVVAIDRSESPSLPRRQHLLSKLWLWTRSRVKIQPRRKRLKVAETVSLGEKRFIAVVQVDGVEFLVGGAPNALSVLAHLETPKTFPEILRQNCEQQSAQA